LSIFRLLFITLYCRKQFLRIPNYTFHIFKIFYLCIISYLKLSTKSRKYHFIYSLYNHVYVCIGTYLIILKCASLAKTIRCKIRIVILCWTVIYELGKGKHERLKQIFIIEISTLFWLRCFKQYGLDKIILETMSISFKFLMLRFTRANPYHYDPYGRI